MSIMLQHAICWWRLRWQTCLWLFPAILLVAACDGSGAVTHAKQAIAHVELPAEFGRGYPVAQVDAQPEPGGLLKPGDIAPDFSLVLDDGRYLRLSDLQGQPVLLNFWATWCGPCRLEMPELVKAANADENLVVLAVDVQEARSAVEEFAAEFNLTIPVVLDSEGKVRNLFRVPGLPTTYFIDRSGKIASVVVGPLTPQVLADRLAEIRQ